MYSILGPAGRAYPAVGPPLDERSRRNRRRAIARRNGNWAGVTRSLERKTYR